ncbi:MAG: molybdenum cofactor biosynthesis protein [Acidilobus sp.]
MRKLKVRVYSVLREELGSPDVELEVPDNAKVSDVLQAISHRAPRSFRVLQGGLRVIADGVPLGPNDEIPRSVNVVHVLPPSAGGEDKVLVRVLRDEGVDLGEVMRFLSGDLSVGAVAIFVGVVRGLNRGERVTELRYEHAGELLEGSLRKIGEEAVERFGLSKVFIAHYVGVRLPGQLTMVVGVSSTSRTQAFPALQWIVDKVKHEAPIWKEEVRESGRFFIVGDSEIRAEDLARS